MIRLTCKEVEDENDDEDEDDWGSRGRELRPTIDDFYWMAFLLASSAFLIVLVLVLVLGLWVSGLFRNLPFIGALDHAIMTGFLKRHRMLSALK